MREMIFAYLDAGGAGLDPNVRKAIEGLQQVAEKSRAAIVDTGLLAGCIFCDRARHSQTAHDI